MHTLLAFCFNRLGTMRGAFSPNTCVSKNKIMKPTDFAFAKTFTRNVLRFTLRFYREFTTTILTIHTFLGKRCVSLVCNLHSTRVTSVRRENILAWLPAIRRFHVNIRISLQARYVIIYFAQSARFRGRKKKSTDFPRTHITLTKRISMYTSGKIGDTRPASNCIYVSDVTRGMDEGWYSYRATQSNPTI